MTQQELDLVRAHLIGGEMIEEVDLLLEGKVMDGLIAILAHMVTDHHTKTSPTTEEEDLEGSIVIGQAIVTLHL